uniref:Uncharacterized protein n=1 Tax=Arundo donax TaxID=35708 RepID=A0A0A9B1X2_ARUDO
MSSAISSDWTNLENGESTITNPARVGMELVVNDAKLPATNPPASFFLFGHVGAPLLRANASLEPCHTAPPWSSTKPRRTDPREAVACKGGQAQRHDPRHAIQVQGAITVDTPSSSMTWPCRCS